MDESPHSKSQGRAKNNDTHAAEKVFAMIPLKTEVKAVVSGIYISDIKSVKGGKLIKPEPKKKGFFAKLFKK